jgi:hypothetical protein
MANEIQLTIKGTLDNGTLEDRFDPGAQRYDQATQDAAGDVIAATVSEQNLTIPVTTPGYCFLRNLDTVDSIHFGPNLAAVLIAFGKLGPGQLACFPLDASVTIRFKSSANTPKLQWKVWSA